MCGKKEWGCDSSKGKRGWMRMKEMELDDLEDCRKV